MLHFLEEPGQRGAYRVVGRESVAQPLPIDAIRVAQHRLHSEAALLSLTHSPIFAVAAAGGGTLVLVNCVVVALCEPEIGAQLAHTLGERRRQRGRRLRWIGRAVQVQIDMS